MASTSSHPRVGPRCPGIGFGGTPGRLEMEYRTKEEHVADYLRKRTISGVYQRGSRLKQAEIAEESKLVDADAILGPDLAP